MIIAVQCPVTIGNDPDFYKCIKPIRNVWDHVNAVSDVTAHISLYKATIYWTLD